MSGEQPRVRELFKRAPLAWLWAVNLSRWPMAVAPLALVLLGRTTTGSFALGAALVACYMAGEVVLAPAAGGLLDRFPSRITLAALMLATTAAWFGLIVFTMLQMPIAPALVVAGLAGGSSAGATGGIRALVERVVPTGVVETALTLDATVLELFWILAPAAVAVASLTRSVIAYAILATVPLMVAMASLRLLPAGGSVRIKPDRPHGKRLFSRVTIPLFVTSAVMGLAEGSVAVGVAPFVSELGGSIQLAGLLLALLSAGSVAGGIAYGGLARWLPWTPEVRSNIFLFLFGLALLPTFAVQSVALWAALVTVAGLFIAPFNAARARVLQTLVPRDRVASGFAILSATYTAGFGLSGVVMALLLAPLGSASVIGITASVAALFGASTLVLKIVKRHGKAKRD